MSPDKGAHRAIAVAMEAGLPLKIAGKYREPKELEYFAELVEPHLGPAHGIEYLGEVNHGQKVELLQDASATLFPIEWEEPFGLVMIESMACGTPVIATRWGAVPEVIDDGRTGLIVDDYRQMVPRARAGRCESSRSSAAATSRSASRPSGWSPTTSRAYRAVDREDDPGVTLGALRRSPHDREILRLAVLALGALAAQPTFVLVDTAIVGHLGTPQLAALGIAGLVLGGAFAIFNFLAYGTTSQVSRAAGAGRARDGRPARRAGVLALVRDRDLARGRRRRRGGADRRADGRSTARPPSTRCSTCRSRSSGCRSRSSSSGARGTSAGSPISARRSSSR